MGIPALMPFQVPQQQQFNLADTYVQMARLKAYQQQARLDELKLGQESRKEASDVRWQRLMGGVFTPEEQGGGLTGAPQPMPQAPQPQAPAGGLAGAQAGPQPQMPQGYAGPPSLAATAPTIDQPLPPMGGGMPQGPPPGAPPPGAPPPGAPPPPSLAQAQTPPPQAPAPGLGQGTGTKPMFQGLLRPLNEQRLIEAYKENPERTEKWFTGYMKMQGDKIDQTKKMNGMVYDTLKAVDRSPNPAEAWPIAVASLRDKGIPLPKDLETYNPAMLKFKLNEHRTAEVELTEAKTLHEQMQARAADALGIKYGAETKRTEQGTLLDVKKDVREERQTTSQIGLQSAQAQHALAQTAREKQAKGLDLNKDERAALNEEEDRKGKAQTREFQATAEKHDVAMRPLREKELEIKNRREGIMADTALTEEDRKAKLFTIDQEQKTLNLQRDKIAVPEFVKGEGPLNAAISQYQQKTGKTGAPDGETLQEARNMVLNDKVAVAASHGKDAAAGAVIKDVLTNAATKGQSGEQVHSVLDEIEDLQRQGVLSSKWGESWRVYAQSAGLRPDDEAAARTWAVQSLGERLTLALAGGKLGGQVSDADRDLIAKAAGGMGKLLSPAQQRQAMEQLRRLADQDVEFANRHIKQYNDTKSLPEFGQVRKERLAKTITQAQWDETMRTKPQWKSNPEGLRKFYEDQGMIVRAE